jgi:hypothetical protein
LRMSWTMVLLLCLRLHMVQQSLAHKRDLAIEEST